MSGSKRQKAGDNSQQLQANTVNITNINGIDERRAREIFNDMYTIARKNFTEDAYECANQRISKFEEALMPKILQLNGALEKFADPSFQVLLTEAHKTAASTEREADYDLLSELLIHRIQKGKLRKTIAGIERAVEIVDQIDDDALCALTIAYTVLNFLPTSGNIIEGLSVFQNIFDKLEYLDLPKGIEWLEHLEILNAVRIRTVGEFLKTEQLYTKLLDGYVCVGVKKDSDEYNKAIEIFNNIKLPNTLLVEHELLSGYVRLAIPRQDLLETIKVTEDNKFDEVTTENIINLSTEQKQGLKDIWALYDNSEEMKRKVVNAFIEEWTKRKSLKILMDWWNDLPVAFDITSVGTVLAHANAQRCDPEIPPLD